MSAQVSVNAQKKGGLSFHPIGRLNGIPNRGSDEVGLVASGGRMTARLRAAAAPMRWAYSETIKFHLLVEFAKG
jgi:hypothetical protein